MFPLDWSYWLGLGATAVLTSVVRCDGHAFQHASKIMLFGMRGFDLGDYAWPCALLSLCAVVGSALGTRLLDHLPEKPFKLVVRIVLTALALHQIWQGVSTGCTSQVAVSPPTELGRDVAFEILQEDREIGSGARPRFGVSRCRLQVECGSGLLGGNILFGPPNEKMGSHPSQSPDLPISV